MIYPLRTPALSLSNAYTLTYNHIFFAHPINTLLKERTYLCCSLLNPSTEGGQEQEFNQHQ